MVRVEGWYCNWNYHCTLYMQNRFSFFRCLRPLTGFLVCSLLLLPILGCLNRWTRMHFLMLLFYIIPNKSIQSNELQCRNWDGGKQEYNTALTALRKVYPDAPVVENRIDNYPIRVTISADSQKIWSGHQRNLFSKYASNRTQAMADIEASLKEFKKSKL